jgi:macrolide transport system ATP-binding/permease protein
MICATAVAVALMIVSLGLGASASAQVSEAFDAQANREVSLVAAGTSQPPGLANSVARIGELAGVQQVAALSDNGEATVATAGASFAVTLRGMEGDLEGAASAEVTWMNSAVPYLHERQALVGRALARQLFLAPLALSPSIDIDGRAYAVVGIIENSRRYPLLAGQVIVGETDSLTLRPPGKVEVAIVTMPGAAPQVGQYAALAINPLAPESLVTNVPIDPQSLRQEVEGGVQTALIAFTILAGIAAVITLANVITLSVVARTGEFGLRRAVGARPSDLALLVSSEAALVGLGGGILGLLLGITGLLVFTISQRWLPVLDVRLVPLAVVVGLILAVMSSALGALRAARIAPADALRA